MFLLWIWTGPHCPLSIYLLCTWLGQCRSRDRHQPLVFSNKPVTVDVFECCLWRAETCLLVRCKALCCRSLLLSLCFNLHLFENAILLFLAAGFVLAYRTFSRDFCILYVFSQKHFLKQIKDLVWISASAYFNHFCHSTSGYIWKQNGQ